MIKNIEFVILKKGETIDKPENFNSEFSSLAYYYTLKLKKINIASCSYIKIRAINEEKKNGITFFASELGVLYISLSIDFSVYLLLNHTKKLKYQYELLYYILKQTFIEYNVDWKVLDEINNQLLKDNCGMQYEYIKKRIEKEKIFKLILKMEINSFLFLCEVVEGNKKKSILIFKSIPSFLAVEYLFNRYKIINSNTLRIGSKERTVFEINLDEGLVILINNNELVRKLEYKHER